MSLFDYLLCFILFKQYSSLCRNMYELKEGRQMKPKTFASMVSNMLYERRFGPFFVEPIVAGLDPVTFEPYVCNMDLIGCINNPPDFIGMLAFFTLN